MAAFRFVRPLQILVQRSFSAIRLLEPGLVNHGNLSKQVCVYTNTLKRFQSSATTEEGTETSETEKPKSWFIRWLHGEVPEPEPARTEEELNERRILLEKVQEMYFSNPPKSPGVDFYIEAFNLLIKYDDRVGVENLYEVMKEEKIDAGDQLIERIESYILKARDESWYK